MDAKTLSYFYKDDGSKMVFLKNYWIRVIRNKVIDPNTKVILDHGFSFSSSKLEALTYVPCDDSNFCEYLTFKEGLELGIVKLPFTLKLHHDDFYRVDTAKEFSSFLAKVIDFRLQTVKKGWAIKYGVEYEDIQYPLLEDLDEQQLLAWRDPRANVKYSMDDVKERDLLYEH